MKHAIAIVTMLTSAAAVLAQSPASKIAPSKGWLNNLSAGRDLAQKTGRPMMVVFRCDL